MLTIMFFRRALAAAAAAVLVLLLPEVAHATTSSGFGWSAGLNQLSTEAKGGLAFAFIIMGTVGGLVEYQTGGQLTGLLMVITRAGMVIGVIGGLVAFASLFGMTAAVV